MADGEKSPFGATHLALSCSHPLRSKDSKESTVTSSDAGSQTNPAKAAENGLSNPFSPFPADPAIARTSEDQQKLTTPTTTHLSPYSYDLEAGSGMISKASTVQPKISVDGRVKECTMWPSKQSLIDKEKERKRRQRGWWNVMTNMNKKQKLWFRIVAVLLLIAAAVGIGVGVSRAVGGGVWAGNGKTKNIDSD